VDIQEQVSASIGITDVSSLDQRRAHSFQNVKKAKLQKRFDQS